MCLGLVICIAFLHCFAPAIATPHFGMRTCRLAGRSYPCPNIFDWVFYNRTYPDVRASSPKKAWRHWINIGIAAGRRCHSGPPVVKLVLMTKDERGLLESWTAYHSHVFAPEDLYIIDGSQTRGWVRPKGPPWVFNFKGQLHNNDLRGAIVKLMRSLSHSCDFILKLDTDELLTVLRKRSNGTYFFDPESVQHQFELLNVTGGMYGIPRWYFSVPDPALCGRDPISATVFEPTMFP
eukprot:RCo051298